jgi:hypothetical protein
METRPPRLIEDIVGLLIPPVCREHVLGDLYERYTSRNQYILDAAATLPFVIASQIRRSFNVQLFFSEACVIYLAFGGASLAAGPAYLYDTGALLPLAIVIGILLLALVFCDAYADPQDRSPRRLWLEVVLSLSCAYAGEGAIRLIDPEWALPMWIMLAGSAVSLPMLMMMRRLFSKHRSDAAVPGGGILTLDERRQKSTREYRKAWRANWIWIHAALAVVVITLKLSVHPGRWEFGGAVFLIVITLLTFQRSKNGTIGVEQRYTSLSIFRNPYRSELERKRDGLLFWAGGGLFALLPGAGPTVILYLIAFPLLMLLVRWIAHVPYASISMTRVWIALVAFVILCATWAFVRTLNLRAAQAMREELELLDSENKSDRSRLDDKIP